MKVGMNILLWTDNPTFKEHKPLIESIKKWGFDGVEFMVDGMAPEDVKAFSKLCDDLGLERNTTIAMDAKVADPASSDAKLRKAAVDYIKKMVDKTVEIGGDLIVGPIYQGLGRFNEAGPVKEDWNWAVDTIREAAEYAKSNKVRLALEPINRFEAYLFNTVADGARFVDDVGMSNVGLLADTHHANIEETNTVEAWKKVVDKIMHVHISENHRGIPGSGHAVPPELFTMLKEAKYDGWLTIEAFNQSVPGLIPRLHLWRRYAPSDEAIAVEGLKYIRANLNR